MTQLTTPVATRLRPDDGVDPGRGRPGEFLVDLDAGWSSLVGVHGGYMCALAVRAAESLAPGRVGAHHVDELPALGSGGPGRAVGA